MSRLVRVPLLVTPREYEAELYRARRRREREAAERRRVGLLGPRFGLPFSPMLLNSYIGAVAGGGGGPSGFSWKRAVTIDHTQVGASDTSNYPLYIDFTDATLKTTGNGGHVQNGSGFDVGLYSDSALTTKLNWETRLYVASTGRIVMIVQVPTVSHTADTVIYLAYGSATITTDQSNQHGTWDSNYKIVNHYGDEVTLSVADSTSNGIAGHTNGPPTATAGQVYGGMNCNGGQDEYSDAIVSANSVTACTVEFWAKPGSNASQRGFFQWGGGGGVGDSINSSPFLLIQNNAGTLQYYADGNYRDTSQSLVTGTWYHLGITFAGGTTWKFFKNGALLSTHTGSAANNGAQLNVCVGAGYNGQINAAFSAFRVSVADRGADYFTTVYNNTKSSSTLVTIGAETAA